MELNRRRTGSFVEAGDYASSQERISVQRDAQLHSADLLQRDARTRGTDQQFSNNHATLTIH